MRTTGVPRWTVLGVALALLLGTTLLLAGCGEELTEEQIERQIEKAMEAEGADVDVEIEDGETGSFTITQDDGEATVSVGSGVDLPDGFPRELLPDDADVQTSMDASDGGEIMQTVAFTCDADLDEMYDWFLEMLPEAGYEIEQKMQFDSDGARGFSISGFGSDTRCNVTGAEADENVYSVMILGE